MPVEGAGKQNHLAYLSIGSNIEPEKNLKGAIRELARFGRVLRVSRVWQSQPLGGQGQNDYLNAALLLETVLSADELKRVCIAEVEALLGRVRCADRNAPRTIDIDIMLFDRERLIVGVRTIPDPEILERPFVAIPLAEIAPDYIHPHTGDTLAMIASRFDPGTCSMRLRSDVFLEAD